MKTTFNDVITHDSRFIPLIGIRCDMCVAAEVSVQQQKRTLFNNKKKTKQQKNHIIVKEVDGARGMLA